MKNNPSLSSMMFINMFEGNCDTFGKGKKPNVVNNIGSICQRKKKPMGLMECPWNVCGQYKCSHMQEQIEHYIWQFEMYP